MNPSNPYLTASKSTHIHVPPECHIQPFSKHSEKWNNMLYELINFKKKHGHCLVPNRYHENPQLGLWVSVQRRQYREFKKEEITVMTIGRVKLLESIGFKWSLKSSAHVSWETRFDELQKYKNQYGDCLVPLGYEENPQLSVWVVIQRDAYKLKMEGKANGIRYEHMMKLAGIDFEWGIVDDISTPHDDSFAATKPSIVTSEDFASTQRIQQHDERSNMPVPCMYSTNQISEERAHMQAPFLPAAPNFPQGQIQIPLSSFWAHQSQSQHHRAELMNELAQMNAIENFARMSMARPTLHTQGLTQQGIPQVRYSPYNNLALESFSNIPSFRDDIRLLPHASSQDTALMMAKMHNLYSPNHYNSIPSTNYTANWLNANSAGVQLPSLEEYDPKTVVSEELFANVKTGTQSKLDLSKSNRAPSTEEKKSKRKRKIFDSKRYPGPQTSDAFWWSRFAELNTFRSKNGHCFVPNRYPPHPALGNWVSTQRRVYKLWKKNKVSSMNKERVIALEGIGFSWNAARTSISNSTITQDKSYINHVSEIKYLGGSYLDQKNSTV